MATLDAKALTVDPAGMAFLADVLGTAGEAALPNRRFPMEAWAPVETTPREDAVGGQSSAGSAGASAGHFMSEMA